VRAARIVGNRREARTRDARRPDGGRSGRRTAMIPRSAPFATRAIDASRRKKSALGLASARERRQHADVPLRRDFKDNRSPFGPHPRAVRMIRPADWAKAQRNSNPSR